MTARRIDTHFHVIPPEYAAWLRSQSIEAGGLMLPEWNRDTALAVMDRFGIETAILSVSTPGVHLGDDAEARTWARAVNDFAADVVRSAPDRFGFFATLCAAHRFAAFASPRRDLADGIEQLRKFYFDTALSGSPIALDSLLAFAKPGHVLYGCDWPYAPSATVDYFTSQYESHVASAGARRSIDHETAEALFPRLRRTAGTA